MISTSISVITPSLFLKDDQIYASFLRAITDFEAHRDILRADKQISNLFKQNPELYINFTWFTADDNCRSHRVRVSETMAPR
nr:hypothetical protein DM860_006032 [Ipomoea batatas]